MHQQKELVIETLKRFREMYPGNAVEIRIPPIMSIQILEGIKHKRGKPPATVEMSPDTWIKLIKRDLDWADGVNLGLIQASGLQSDLEAVIEKLTK